MKKSKLLVGILMASFTCHNVINSEAKASTECDNFTGICRSHTNDIMAVKTISKQNWMQWCWAASMEMVFRYHGFNVPQAKIVQGAWGRLIDKQGDPQTIINGLNLNWSDTDGRSFKSTALGFNYNDPVTAINDLHSNQPLMIGYNTGEGGHAVVLHSLSYYPSKIIQQAGVVDPTPWGQNVRTLNPNEFYGITFMAQIRVKETSINSNIIFSKLEQRYPSYFKPNSAKTVELNNSFVRYYPNGSALASLKGKTGKGRVDYWDLGLKKWVTIYNTLQIANNVECGGRCWW